MSAPNRDAGVRVLTTCNGPASALGDARLRSAAATCSPDPRGQSVEMATDKTRVRLEELAQGAPKRGANVRTLARYAANSTCRLATLGFAARVDFDRMLVGTPYAVPFGQSPFAFRRGNQFEERLRKDGHRPLLDLLGEKLNFDVSAARVANLRSGQPPNKDRAEKTSAVLKRIVDNSTGAPNLIDGAVLTRDIGGLPAYFEADAVAAHFDQPIRAGEIKSFPTVDGQADPDKVGAAMAQVAIYILLLRDEVTRLGGTPELVSPEALLITPLNTGLKPTMTVKALGREIDRADRILQAAPTAPELVADLPEKLPTFGSIANEKESVSARLERAQQLAEAVGTDYQPGCLAACGFSRMCRERSYESGATVRLGAQMTRLLPTIDSLDRAAAILNGAKPTADEAAVAERLTCASEHVSSLVTVRDLLEPPAKRARRSSR